MAQKRLTNKTAQHTEFARMARALGCDDSEPAFDTKLGKVARASVPRKAAKRAAAGKPLKAKAADKPSVQAKKKIRFNLPGA